MRTHNVKYLLGACALALGAQTAIAEPARLVQSHDLISIPVAAVSQLARVFADYADLNSKGGLRETDASGMDHGRG